MKQWSHNELTGLALLAVVGAQDCNQSVEELYYRWVDAAETSTRAVLLETLRSDLVRAGSDGEAEYELTDDGVAYFDELVKRSEFKDLLRDAL